MMTTYQASINPVPGRGAAPVGSNSWTAWAREVLATWSDRYQRRQELQGALNMPDHLLRDMGITREAVYREYRKPFWRA